jgi:hypothetical protein
LRKLVEDFEEEIKILTKLVDNIRLKVRQFYRSWKKAEGIFRKLYRKWCST